MEEEQMLTKEQILDMLDAGQYKELKEELGNMYPVDIAETLEDFEQKPLVMVFRLLAKEEAAETFTYMNSDMREILIGALTDSELEGGHGRDVSGRYGRCPGRDACECCGSSFDGYR